MIKQLVIFIATFFAFSSFVSAKPFILTVQSTFIQPYEDVVQGFNKTCRGKTKRIVLSKYPLVNLTDTIQKKAPELVLAVGLDALDAMKSFSDIPIVYTMVLCADAAALSLNNITGVCMQIPARVQLQEILRVLPKAKRIGLIYDSNESETIVAEALKLSMQFGVTLFAKAAQTPREISLALIQMRGQIDVMWMLPDLTVSHPMAMELFTLFSFENRLPLVTYSEKYLEMGAFMSIGIDAVDIGRQAGEMANRILYDGDAVKILPMGARSPVITINKSIGNKFGIEMGKMKAGHKVKVWDH